MASKKHKNKKNNKKKNNNNNVNNIAKEENANVLEKDNNSTDYESQKKADNISKSTKEYNKNEDKTTTDIGEKKEKIQNTKKSVNSQNIKEDKKKEKIEDVTKSSKNVQNDDVAIAYMEKKIEESTKKEKSKEKQKKDVKKDEIPEYVEEIIESKKKNFHLVIIISLILFVILMLSTTFALINLGKTTFAKGVKIRNIDISNLTMQEASNKVNEAIETELIQEMKLKHEDEYEINFIAQQIEYTYDIDSAINEAYKIGRSSNIISNNYELILTAFFGKNIMPKFTYNEEALDYIMQDIASKVPNIVVEPTYYIEGEELIINKGLDGIVVETDKLEEIILHSLINRKAKDIVKDNLDQIIDIPTRFVKADTIDIDKIYSEIYTEPKDAYFLENPFQIFAEVSGVDFAITKEEARNIIISEDKDEYIIPIKISPPEKTINDIGLEAFPFLISTYTTKYDASNTNRSKNLNIAAQKINGTVLMPGEVFSFNKIVGKRTVEDGYTNAKIYANGQVVDGLAGGICQISSTLYNSVLLANLEIVERRNHSFRTSYVPAGRDATVVYGTTDFQFKNSRTYPIKITASVSNGIAEFSIYGIKEEIEYEVKIIPITTQSMPYGTEYIEDVTLQSGMKTTIQAGFSGCKTTTYRELRINGVVTSKELLSNDTYNPLKAIVRIGP